MTAPVPRSEASRPSRRTILKAGAATAGAMALTSALGFPAAFADDSVDARTVSFDAGWLFHLGELQGAEAAGFDDAAWRRLDLPHDWSIEDLPGGSEDGGATAQPSHLFFFEDPGLAQKAPKR